MELQVTRLIVAIFISVVYTMRKHTSYLAGSSDVLSKFL